MTADPADALPPLDVAKRVLSAGRQLLAEAGELRQLPDVLHEQTLKEHALLWQQLVSQHLAAMPLQELRRAPAGRGLKLPGLQAGGYDTVSAVLAATPAQLTRLDQVGQSTADAAVRAAQELRSAVARDTVVRFDMDRKDAASEPLLRCLRVLDTATNIASATTRRAEQILSDLDDSVRGASGAGTGWRRWFMGSRGRARAIAALRSIEAVLSSVNAAAVRAGLAEMRRAVQEAPDVPTAVLWAGYERRAAVYHTLLDRVRGMAGADAWAAQGFVEPAMAHQAEHVELNVSLLRVRLRAYQAFGARYALARRRVIIGDEMGLGKTIEAIAVMAHLAADRHHHRFLVAAPASVLFNWINEIHEHSTLSTYRAHGPQRDRQAALASWAQHGGVAVTTIDTLAKLQLPTDRALDLLIVDEAHLAKNPEANRSRAVHNVTRTAQRALFLTGTPMENRVSEFQQLISYLQAELAAALQPSDSLLGARDFRRKVSPVYLRRQQHDVLQELPELLEMDDWLELNPAEAHAYRDAVDRRHFPDMRRAAYRGGDSTTMTAKLERLKEIVRESADNNWKVVIFSYFREVLDRVREATTESPTFMMTGDVPPGRRPQLVNEFSESDGHAILIGQIQVLGTGLNIQAASVVVLSEPQLKPSTEDQAIKRCYRRTTRTG